MMYTRILALNWVAVVDTKMNNKNRILNKYVKLQRIQINGGVSLSIYVYCITHGFTNTSVYMIRHVLGYGNDSNRWRQGPRIGGNRETDWRS